METVYHDSGKYIRFTAGAGYSAGDVIAWGTGIAIVEVGCLEGQECNACVEGTFEFAKATGGSTARTLGATVGYDTTNDRVADVSGADLYCGRVMKAASDDDATVLVAINKPAAESLA